MEGSIARLRCNGCFIFQYLTAPVMVEWNGRQIAGSQVVCNYPAAVWVLQAGVLYQQPSTPEVVLLRLISLQYWLESQVSSVSLGRGANDMAGRPC